MLATTTRTLSINELMFIGNTAIPAWEANKTEIKVKGRALFHLVGLKKEFERHLGTAQEALAIIAEQNGGVLNPQIGGYEIPEENRETAGEAMREFSQGKVEVKFTPVVLGPEDEVPIAILDAFFDYIEIVE